MKLGKRVICLVMAAMTAVSITALPAMAKTDLKGLSAKKVGEISAEIEGSLTCCAGGVIYKQNGNYGILSLDGNTDTGAIYAYCFGEGANFVVVSANSTPKDPNFYGLVDASGKQILPEKYALFDSLSDRFVQVYTATEKTSSEKEAILYTYDVSSGFSIKQVGPEEGDTLYKGYWQIYDLETGDFVKDFKETRSVAIDVQGEFIQYRGAYKGIHVTKDGPVEYETSDIKSPIKHVFADGSYEVKKEDKLEIYAPDSTLLFSNNEAEVEDFDSVVGDYYKARIKKDKTSYVALYDKKGKRVSKEAKGIGSVFGEGLEIKEKDDKYFCGFDGKHLLKYKITRMVISNENFPNWGFRVAAIESDKKFAIVDEKANVLFKGDSSNKKNYTNGTLCKKSGDKTLFYCYQDQKFSISGQRFFSGIVKADNSDKTKSLIDCVTGEKLIDGYKDYKSVNEIQLGNGDTLYVYAKKADGKGYDIYTIH